MSARDVQPDVCASCGVDYRQEPDRERIPVGDGRLRMCVDCAPAEQLLRYVRTELVRLEQLLTKPQFAADDRIRQGRVMIGRSGISWAREELGHAMPDNH